MFRFFKRKQSIKNPVLVDIHSHLLPGLDDGVEMLEESLQIIKTFEALGYKKVITTPHILSDFYKNSPETILPVLKELQKYILGKTNVIVEAAAEYYLDETFINLINEGKKKLLTLGNDFILFETSFMSEPVYLKEAIFKIQSLGLKPILAHPERYQYLHNDWALATDLFERGTYFQINLNSLSGYYSIPVKKMVAKLIKSKMVHFFGSDCHNPKQIEVFQDSLKTPLFSQLAGLNLLNNQLL